VRAFLVGALLAIFLIGLAAPADAHPAQTCYSIDAFHGIYNTEGTDSAQIGSHTGISSFFHIASYGGYAGFGDCIRVSSIGILAAGGGYVELGWYLGWDTSNGNLYSGPGACVEGVYYGQGVHPSPEVFVVWKPNNSGYHCKDLFGEDQDVFRHFKIEDSDQDTSFKYYEAGTFLGSVGVNFSRGTAYTNGERHNAQLDSAFSNFESLSKFVAGLTGAYDFTTSTEISMGSRDDPDYHWQRDTDVHTEVVRD